MSFLGKITKIITSVNFEIFTKSPFVWFSKFFTKIDIIGMANFSENHEVRDFTLVIIFFIFTEKWQFRLENENYEISRNSALFYMKKVIFIKIFQHKFFWWLWKFFDPDWELNLICFNRIKVWIKFIRIE